MTLANQYREFVSPLLVKAFTSVNGRMPFRMGISRFSLISGCRATTCRFARYRTKGGDILRSWQVCPPFEGQFRLVFVDRDRER